MPKVLISDSIDKIAAKILESNNIQVDITTDLSSDKLKEIISKYDGLIVRSSTKATKDIIEAGHNLKIIGRAGAGVDNIDLETANKKNVIVMNTPGGNTNATAEHTLSLLFSLARSIPSANSSTHEGLWEKKKFKGNEIKGKTIGIIGFGNVGKRFAEMCFGLGLKIKIHSKHLDSIKNEYKNYESVDLTSLIQESDIVSFHCKPSKDNKPLINFEMLKLMKKNALIINTARGNLVDENDLKTALEEGLIKGAAFDVFSSEPATESVLFNVPNLILTPHIAASTVEAQIIVAEQIAKQISEYFNNGKVINAVN